MYSVTLTKIVSNHNNLRDPVIQGYIFDIPEIGQPLLFIAPARDEPKDTHMRRITTSLIKDILILDENCFVLKTENSVYKLSNIKELPDETLSKSAFN